MSHMKAVAVVVGLVFLAIVTVPFVVSGPTQEALTTIIIGAAALAVLAIKGLVIFALAYLGARLAIRHERGTSGSVA